MLAALLTHRNDSDHIHKSTTMSSAFPRGKRHRSVVQSVHFCISFLFHYVWEVDPNSAFSSCFSSSLSHINQSMRCTEITPSKHPMIYKEIGSLLGQRGQHCGVTLPQAAYVADPSNLLAMAALLKSIQERDFWRWALLTCWIWIPLS